MIWNLKISLPLLILESTKLDSTRNSEHKLCVHFTQSKTREFAFSNTVAPTWNSLLSCTKKAPSIIISINQFLSLLDKDPNLLVLVFYYDEENWSVHK